MGAATVPSKREEKVQALQQTVDTAIERLAEQLSQGHSAEYQRLLAFYSQFWKYSIANQILIQTQKPDATRVAAFGTWKKLGYQVRKGEKGIAIWVPLLTKVQDEQTGEEVELCTGFKVGYVFDVSQLADLEEKPLPSLWKPLPDDVGEVVAEVEACITHDGGTVKQGTLPPGTQGLCRPDGTIIIKQGLDSRNRLFVTCHEWAHLLAHTGKGQAEKPKNLREWEAESASFVVATSLGIEHPWASDYLAAYHCTSETLKASLSAIQGIVRHMLRAIHKE